jgi:bifunctional UDP-N-acetylglucosamine pyrophosphorylase/glucosamine-1-phosphate N-acetyltransferase
MQQRIQRQLLDSGVSIVSPINTYIESGVTMGTDTVIEPFTFIGRDSSIGAECCIGPFASVPRESIVPEGTTVSGNISYETTTLSQSGS